VLDNGGPVRDIDIIYKEFGAKALKSFQTQPEGPDIVLLAQVVAIRIRRERRRFELYGFEKTLSERF
jgi:hypothetical protein